MSNDIENKTSSKSGRKHDAEFYFNKFDELPDSCNPPISTYLLIEDISEATFWRRVKSCLLPRPYKGKVNVGEYRRMKAQLKTSAA